MWCVCVCVYPCVLDVKEEKGRANCHSELLLRQTRAMWAVMLESKITVMYLFNSGLYFIVKVFKILLNVVFKKEGDLFVQKKNVV